ncbi:ribonuclease P protein subunit p38-like [Anneissia japonica]|uniref:ribonuclease P protein subunit p38-like n=1 Tax=Anneissia japonica TaxID=1529436 RepID=UPI0014258564|nr:ribonuclease P protein subunit p38-like [Anneissia japonica]
MMVDDNNIVSLKSTLCTPYPVEWPLLEKGGTQDILNAIQRTFEPLKDKLARMKSRGRKNREHATKIQEGSQNINPRSQILIGINEVTRGLERGLLRCVVVCRSTKPSHMTNHLLTLSATRETPALCLFRLSEIISPLLNLNTVMAIGFKKTSGEISVFEELVELIVQKTPKVNLPWLQEGKISLEKLKIDHPRDILTTRTVVQGTASKKGETGDEGTSSKTQKNQEVDHIEPLPLGVKRSSEESFSEQQKKHMKNSVSPIKIEYQLAKIEKVKIIPKKFKSKKKKKRKKKAKAM